MSAAPAEHLILSGPAVPPRLATTNQHRTARLVPSRSVQAVLARVIRDVLAPGWTPPRAARHLVEGFEDDAPLLRRARSRLRAAATADRMTRVQARALATLDLAIDDVQGRALDGSTDSGERRRGRNRGK